MPKSVYTTISTILLKQISQGREVKLALAVIADVRRGVRAGLQSICANNFAGGEVFNDQVIANVIEGIDIEAGEMRLPQALVQFQVENLKP